MQYENVVDSIKAWSQEKLKDSDQELSKTRVNQVKYAKYTRFKERTKKSR